MMLVNSNHNTGYITLYDLFYPACDPIRIKQIRQIITLGKVLRPHRCISPRRGDAVDPNTIVLPLLGQSLGQIANCRFSC